MNITYHAPFSINPYLKNLIEEKLERIEDLQLRFVEVDIFFKLKEGQFAPFDKELEIKMNVPRQTLFAKSNSDTFEKAIPLAVERVRRQIVRYKKELAPKRIAVSYDKYLRVFERD